MRPPECAICGNDALEDKGGLIYFKKRVSDMEWDRKMQENDFVGHPPYAEWFCSIHYKTAIQYQNMTIDLAKKDIRKILQLQE